MPTSGPCSASLMAALPPRRCCLSAVRASASLASRRRSRLTVPPRPGRRLMEPPWPPSPPGPTPLREKRGAREGGSLNTHTHTHTHALKKTKGGRGGSVCVHREGDWEVRGGGMTLMCAFLLLLYLPASTATDPPTTALDGGCGTRGCFSPALKPSPRPRWRHLRRDEAIPGGT